MSSFFLEAQGLKIKSYPFDWIFSKQISILKCIEDDFKEFLNVNSYLPHPENPNCIYHPKLEIRFPHNRNPLNDMPYYERCVERFNKMIESGEPALFVTTFKNRNLLEAELRKLNENIHFIEIHGRRKKVESLHLIDKEYDLRKKFKIKLK
jgi:hypothetical protein